MLGPSLSSTVENFAVLELCAALAQLLGQEQGFPGRGGVRGQWGMGVLRNKAYFYIFFKYRYLIMSDCKVHKEQIPFSSF
jgi:hypothetical protein